MTEISIAETTPSDTYQALAASLHGIADCIDHVARDVPEPIADCDYVVLSVLPSVARYPGDADRTEAVDVLGQAILGRVGERRASPGGPTGWTHIVEGRVGPVRVSLHTPIAGPGPDEVQAELIRLRAENAALRRELAEDEADAYPERAEAVAR